MKENGNDFIWNVLNGVWKKNASIFWVIILWLTSEISYITGTVPNNDETWYQAINIWYILIISLIPVIILIYISYKRCHIKKAKRGTVGILFCISYTDDRQFEVVNDKFIKPFRVLMNKSNQTNYDVVILNEYVSNKYAYKLEMNKNRKQLSLNLLKKANCKMLIRGNCIACGNSEENLCKIELTGGISHRVLDSQINKILEKNLTQIFIPLQEIYISKKYETIDFSNNAEIMGLVFQHILATTNLFCENLKIALENFRDLRNTVLLCKNNSQIVSQIKKFSNKGLGICYIMLANKEYQKFVVNRKITHLKNAIEYISHPEIEEVNYNKNGFMAICTFKINRDVDKALSYIEHSNSKDVLTKINLAFLKLFKRCNATNIRFAYQAYKNIDKISEKNIYEIENFIYEEYQYDNSKSQLSFLLTLIYLHQENLQLAKQSFDDFCIKHADLSTAKSLEQIILSINKQLKSVPESDG